MKYEWRKKDKEIYLPKNEPTLVELPPMLYLSIVGEGNPNSGAFSKDIEALYSLSYGIKMLPKKGITPEGYFEYTVFPLEGQWTFNEAGIKLYQAGTPSYALKDYLKYKIMIRQPDFVTNKLFNQVKESVYNKKKNERIHQVDLETISEGLCVQMLHIGSYDDEPASFERMMCFLQEKNLLRVGHEHKEIYLSDPKKVEPNKLKTTLRFPVSK